MYLCKLRPELEKGNAAQFIATKAIPYLTGKGLDIGCNKWKIKKDAIGVDIIQKPGVDLIIKNWNLLETEKHDYVFSSHCLEHIFDWQLALFHWMRTIRNDGILFLYLPNPTFYNRWSKYHQKSHKHDFSLPIIVKNVKKFGLEIIEANCDEYASMWVVGRKKHSTPNLMKIY